MLLKFEDEKKLIFGLLQQLGASKDESNTTAEVLAEGDLRGMGSHGILRLPYILRSIKRGTIVPRAEVKIVRETPATALLDGGHGFGQWVGRKAMELAIKKAKGQGIATVGASNTNHFGIAGYYAELAVKEELVGVVTTTTDPLVHPWGGVEPVLGTNALAIGIPTEPPVLLDMAMSMAARGKLVNAMKQGKAIPEGWAIDGKGRPTANPAEGLKGALSPFGGVKGYGLAFILELLAGPLVGAEAGKRVHGTLEPVERFSTKGDLMIAIDPGVFTSLEEFRHRAGDFISEVKNSKKVAGVVEILVPGEPEFRTREKRLREGIPIPDKVWNDVRQTAEKCGLKFK
jgi:L-2-hydroxycarboxylate dehydrogenase (NAD+)